MQKFLFALLLVAAINGAYAQTSTYNPSKPPIFPQAPNSAVLERFGDYEVSMFTGVPDISIPLYTIKTAGFEVPITLSYHASGLKVTDFPSWVGLGWAIDAGGQINRNMVGIADENSLNGWLSGKTRSDLTINPYSSIDMSYLAVMAGNEPGLGNYGTTSAMGDTGPDIFSYSYPGGGGKFFFNKIDSLHFTPVLMPYAPVNIAYTKTPGNLSFNLKDEKGNKYQYGKSVQEASTYTETGFTSAQVTAWMLEQMVSTTKSDSINFAYQAQTDPTPQEISHTWTVTDRINEGNVYGPSLISPPTLATWNPFPGYTEYTAGASPATTYSSSTLGSEQLQQITYKNGKVIFVLDNTARQDFNQTNNSKPLKQIKVYSSTTAGDVLLKTVTFFYDYFISGTDATTKRLRLDSIEVSDANSSVIKSYRFVYNIAINLPAWNSLSKDYWGYFNGRSNSYLVPQQTVPYWPDLSDASTSTNITIGSSNPIGREPDSVNMQAAVLQRIYYPTGGYTDFQYETNKYFDSTSMAVKLAGGLRIKSIQSYDGISANPLIKTYQYGASGLGTASFYITNLFFSNEKQHQYYVIVNPNTGDPQVIVLGSTARVRTFFENPTINISPIDGSPVVYPFVIEYSTDGTNVLGKTEYRYNYTPDNTQILSTASGLDSKTVTFSRSYARGQLLDKKVFKAISTGVYQPLEEETNTYNASSFAGTNVFGGLLVDQAIIREGTTGLAFLFYTTATTNYDWLQNNLFITSDDNYLTSTTKKTYNADDSTKYVSTATQYNYTNFIHQQPSQTIMVDSKGETLVTNSRYAADYIPNGSTVTGNAVLDTILARNMQTAVVEQWSTLQKPSLAAVTTGGEVSTYKLQNNFIALNQQSRLKVLAPLTDFVPATLVSGVLQTDSRYEPLISYNQYDSYGNIQEVQQVNGAKDVYLWGYNGEYPVAKITGSDYATVLGIVTQSQINSVTALPNNDAAVRTLLNNLRTGLPNAQVTTLTFSPGTGLTSETDPKGEITYYEYDALQRLMNIKDTNGNIIKHYDYHYQGH